MLLRSSAFLLCTRLSPCRSDLRSSISLSSCLLSTVLRSEDSRCETSSLPFRFSVRVLGLSSLFCDLDSFSSKKPPNKSPVVGCSKDTSFFFELFFFAGFSFSVLTFSSFSMIALFNFATEESSSQLATSYITGAKPVSRIGLLLSALSMS